MKNPTPYSVTEDWPQRAIQDWRPAGTYRHATPEEYREGEMRESDLKSQGFKHGDKVTLREHFVGMSGFKADYFHGVHVVDRVHDGTFSSKTLESHTAMWSQKHFRLATPEECWDRPEDENNDLEDSHEDVGMALIDATLQKHKKEIDRIDEDQKRTGGFYAGLCKRAQKTEDRLRALEDHATTPPAPVEPALSPFLYNRFNQSASPCIRVADAGHGFSGKHGSRGKYVRAGEDKAFDDWDAAYTADPNEADSFVYDRFTGKKYIDLQDTGPPDKNGRRWFYDGKKSDWHYPASFSSVQPTLPEPVSEPAGTSKAIRELTARKDAECKKRAGDALEAGRREGRQQANRSNRWKSVWVFLIAALLSLGVGYIGGVYSAISGHNCDPEPVAPLQKGPATRTL
jgi:hypothetical protein